MTKEKKRIPVVEIKLAPYIQPNLDEPIETKRLRPSDALNINSLEKELEANTVTKINIKDHTWSIISVYSPYSVDVHVMLMETGGRYLPSPEYIETDEEGKELMSFWVKIVEFLKRDKDQRIFIGYNWSPRSWGEIEEISGFQSIPTKWHPMFWSWPPFKEEDKLTYLSWNEFEKLKVSFKRMNGENKFVAPIAKYIKKEADSLIENAFGKKEESFAKESFADEKGFIVTFDGDLASLLIEKNFFSKFLKPLSEILTNHFKKLTDIFIGNDQCSKIDEILKKTSTKELSVEEIKTIRAFPRMNDENNIKDSLKELDFNEEAIDELISIVNNRNTYAKFYAKLEQDLERFKFEQNLINEVMSEIWNIWQDDLPAWRKGFAYALVFEELKNSNNKEETMLRIVPAAYSGDGGIVEATGVVLKRHENQKPEMKESKEKSKKLHTLKKDISNMEWVYTSEGDKTQNEIQALRLEIEELKKEKDLLKKATAHFASLSLPSMSN